MHFKRKQEFVLGTWCLGTSLEMQTPALQNPKNCPWQPLPTVAARIAPVRWQSSHLMNPGLFLTIWTTDIPLFCFCFFFWLGFFVIYWGLSLVFVYLFIFAVAQTQSLGHKKKTHFTTQLVPTECYLKFYFAYKNFLCFSKTIFFCTWF